MKMKHKYIFFSLVLIMLSSCVQEKAMKKDEEYYAKLRKQMVEHQIIARGVKDANVIRAMEKVPRHKFVPEAEQPYAYLDEPRPIGHGQTISQPYIVAFMTEQLHLKPTDRVLEIGTGSGYQAAVLAEIVDSVYTIEIVPELARKARQRLQELGYHNVEVKQGDGYNGWPEKAPFDAIIVTAAPPNIPPPLLEQLKVGGVMVLPVGEYVQELVVAHKTSEGISMKNVLPVRFVPMTGKVQQNKN
ncbi:MAG TPA: protein-L-isoaspartate(D-aspartate) O-methyltransferase [Caldithrix abyssi]|uniref:Protein-L-isoaspartate O-methyltransferase n=1 Tax=Caldithrix abyssi TaxID=187145 RepID=A0A7V5H3J9_CALAY|nr:protein-L-isoaspartate(D-aspartate) O-methyltransferase [Caldithrix abyssi]